MLTTLPVWNFCSCVKRKSEGCRHKFKVETGCAMDESWWHLLRFLNNHASQTWIIYIGTSACQNRISGSGSGTLHMFIAKLEGYFPSPPISMLSLNYATSYDDIIMKRRILICLLWQKISRNSLLHASTSHPKFKGVVTVSPGFHNQMSISDTRQSK